jgi:hypothetical protein
MEMNVTLILHIFPLLCHSQWNTEGKKLVPPCFTKHIAMKTYGALEVQHHQFPNLTLDRCKWSSYRWGHSPRQYGTEIIQINAAISKHDITFRKKRRYMFRLNCSAVIRPCYNITKGVFYNSISGLHVEPIAPFCIHVTRPDDGWTIRRNMYDVFFQNTMLCSPTAILICIS